MNLTGQLAEEAVLNYFLKNHYKLINRNFKTPFAEVDLLLKNNEAFLLVEVKTAPKLHFEQYRLSYSQRQRLLRAYYYLSKHFKPLRTALVWVYPSGEVKAHFDFLTI